MFDGKFKAITFSYDDGITQDKRLIEIFDKYGLKATFNINSDLLGTNDGLIRNDVTVAHVKPRACEVADIYKNHEVAAHTLTHPRLPEIADDNEIIRQVEQDRIALSKIVGYDVCGMAYPCAGINNDDRVAEIIKNYTGVKYCRTADSNYSFDLQSNLYRFDPTIYHIEYQKTEELANAFLNLKADKPQIFYIFGHSFEFDIDNSWGWFEDLCRELSGREDIFYGTNRQVFGL